MKDTLTSRIKTGRPIKGVSLRVSMAFLAASGVVYSTTPQPLDLPVGIVKTSAKATSPAIKDEQFF